MFIRSVKIKNYRLFRQESDFTLDDINVPDLARDGSGLTVVVGENGCGKSALLNAIALPLLSYKADAFSITDLNDPKVRAHIEVIATSDFKVDSAMPKGSFQAKGLSFEGGLRAKDYKSYLSSIVVGDQKYIRADGQDKPPDNSPDLRVSVHNPFKGSRFNENDILYLDRNRVFQTRSGTYNPTRFDRLMEDFSFQYVKAHKDDNEDVNSKLADLKRPIENKFLENAVATFEELSGCKIVLNFVDNWRPFEKCFFAQKKENNQLRPLDMLGSGYEMIFSLLYSFYLTQQSGKQLIALIDEPDLHLHPSLQERFVRILLGFSKSGQIILSTHSPLLVKHLLSNRDIKAVILNREGDDVKVDSMEDRILPFVSANEVNYLAFGLASEEHHNELYEELKHRKGDGKYIKDFDVAYFQKEKREEGAYPWKGHAKEVSIHTFVRNQIHHQRQCGKPSSNHLETSISQMRGYLRELVGNQLEPPHPPVTIQGK